MYDFTDKGIMKDGKEGGIQLTNFTAKITKEINYEDGKASQRILVIEGKLADEKLPPVEVPSEKFASMNWITPSWGIGPVISPIPNAERDVRVAIQYESKPTKTTVYTHTGWVKIGGKSTFLMANGGITEKGLNEKLTVLLPNELRKFTLKPDDSRLTAGVNAVLDLRKIATKDISWVLIASTIRPPIGPVDYAVHMSGRTGTFKSEIASIMQSFYGVEMDARHLPGSWSSTANAIEAQTYKAKNCVFVLDDFVPFGTAWQVRAYQKTADQVIRGQGNQSGRARLTDVSALQETMYPRGMILSTGEDIPTGHSIRARMMILDLAPGDITTTALTTAQHNRELYQIAMAGWVQHIARQGVVDTRTAHTNRKTALRKKHADVGHSRTPAMLGDLIATIEMFLDFATSTKAIAKRKATTFLKEATDALIAAAEDQDRHLKTTDPTEVFMDVLRLMLQTQVAHLRALDGGIPQDPEHYGWTKNESQHGGITTYVAHGQKIGWVDQQNGSIYLEPNVTFPLIMKNSRGGITTTKTTMIKRLKDAGLLNRTDDARQRNTIRCTCEGRMTGVLSIDFAQITQTLEMRE